ncbi:hypothetical protein [Sedimenticola hydrogenitrophicus]|uniref:hypothetical protein n=1 Tax=Sedimenticola hydrogenitrophicus TaxID=2967975 RepID=UPI0023AFCBBD|nr:hypothetical protein [Sedimenticola hydrogenitrophicus]
MALCSEAVMALFYDIAGDHADHDDWHTYEHMHERLSIPGFIRATRWVAKSAAPRYMVIYEVADTDVATSPAYLERLNHPTPWTASMMNRFRGMIRGFSTVAASSGYGLGHAAVSVRFTPAPGEESRLTDRLAREVLPAMASRRGMAGVHLLRPVAPPPMTNEQAIRGPDAPVTWLLLATGYDAEALRRATDHHLDPEALERYGALPGMELARYALHYTVTAQEVAATEPNPTLPPDARSSDGVRR